MEREINVLSVYESVKSLEKMRDNAYVKVTELFELKSLIHEGGI